jgi:tRNA-Thr(GGU) m(6)t(6)A37 methyltransferase TsaA
MDQYLFETIGSVSTCFKEKFGIPRQSGLVTNAKGVLKLKADPFFKNALRELDQFSHIWLIFVFHQHDAKNWKPSIRPPRLGGARKVGVFASRSPHRPNPIGLSVVKLDRIDFEAAGGIELHLSGVDLLDGTPVIDIKPYLPYADSLPTASSGWADAPIERTEVIFTEESIRKIEEVSAEKYPNLKELIVGMLELDPRPAFQKRRLSPMSDEANGTCYGFRLFEFDVKWKIQDGTFVVTDLLQM